MPHAPRRRNPAISLRRLLTGTVLALASACVLTPTEAVAATDPIVVASYVTNAQSGCETGDLPLAGGYHAYGDPHLLHLHPEGGSGSRGTWNVDHESVGPTDVVCLDLGRPVTWTVRSKNLSPGSPDGSVSCQTNESLLGGGYYLAWGPGGMTRSHPEPPMKWHVKGAPYTEGDAPSATTYALCAELPTEARTYTVTANGSGAGDVTASCFAGHAVIGGGWAGPNVRGSGPVDGGWTASFGDGGGSAYAVCVPPGAVLGLERTYAATSASAGSSSAFVTASCNAGDVLLGGGWRSGGPLSTLRVFEPLGAGSGGSGAGWQVDNGPASALCGVPFVEPPPVFTVSRVGFGLLGLAGIAAVIIGATGRPRLAPVTGLRPGLLVGGAAATIGAVVLAVTPAGVTPADQAQARHPLDYQTVLPGAIPTTGPVSPAPSTSAGASTSAPSTTATTTPTVTATTTTATTTGSTTAPRPEVTTTSPRATSTSSRPKPTSSRTTTAPPSVTLTASPATSSDTCAPYAPPVNVTLSPGQSQAAVSWTATVTTKLDNGQWWATLEGGQQTTVSGTIAVGSSATLTITPRNPDACQQTGTFHVTVTYGPAGYPQTKSLTVSDTLKRLG